MRYLFVFLFAGCASFQYGITSKTDKFDGTSEDRMKNNYISSTATIELNAIRANERTYALNCIYTGKDWMFLNSSGSLVLIIDGEKLQLSCDEPFRDTFSSKTHVYVYETANYIVDKDVICKIGKAQKVSLKIYGQRRDHEGELTRTNIERLADFCLRF